MMVLLLHQKVVVFSIHIGTFVMVIIHKHTLHLISNFCIKDLYDNVKFISCFCGLNLDRKYYIDYKVYKLFYNMSGSFGNFG